MTRESKKKKTAFYYCAFVVALAFAAMFQSSGMPTDSLRRVAYQNIANIIGISSAVAPNQYNQLAQQLAQKELEISSRELELVERERVLGEQYRSALFRSQQTVFYAIFAVALFLLSLILLNFYLDHIREKKTDDKRRRGELQTKL